MDKKDLKWLKNYVEEKNLQIGSHCTSSIDYPSIKKFGISHTGDISSTILFNYAKSLEGLKTISHKDSDCVVVVGIPREFATKLYYQKKESGENYFESDEFCEIAPKEAHLPHFFVLNHKYIIGMYKQKEDEFVLNEEFIGENKDYKQLVKNLLNSIDYSEKI